MTTMDGAAEARPVDSMPPAAGGASGLPESASLLLRALVKPHAVVGLSLRQWDLLIRAGRSARLLGTLAERIKRTVGVADLPAPVVRHFEAAIVEATFRASKLRFLLDRITPLLEATAPSAILLKGAAYEMQSSLLAKGRLPADVDVLVPRDRIDTVELALLHAGWEYEKTSKYDQHYYRAWSHELPPMRCAGQSLELDLHHAILPPQGRLRPDSQLLWKASVEIAGTPFRALSAIDQALHVAAHLFEDSDCSNRLRDLVDFEVLAGELSPRMGPPEHAAARLVERAERLNLVRPLAYAASFAAEWLESAVSVQATRILEERGLAPWRPVRYLMSRALLPPDPDGQPGMRAWLRNGALEGRALWFRLPPHLIAVHTSVKAARAIGAFFLSPFANEANKS